jgi:hypothetical protein
LLTSAQTACARVLVTFAVPVVAAGSLALFVGVADGAGVSGSGAEEAAVPSAVDSAAGAPCAGVVVTVGAGVGDALGVVEGVALGVADGSGEGATVAVGVGDGEAAGGDAAAAAS